MLEDGRQTAVAAASERGYYVVACAVNQNQMSCDCCRLPSDGSALGFAKQRKLAAVILLCKALAFLGFILFVIFSRA